MTSLAAPSSMGMSRNTSTARAAREMYDMKKRAMQYYAENGVPDKMEEILNAMFHEEPNDPYGHVSNFFETFAKPPTITKVLPREVLDSKGQLTVQTEIYCMLKNFEQLMTTATMPSVNTLLENAKVEERDIEDEAREKSVCDALKYIQTEVPSILYGKDPTKQRELDNELGELFKRLSKEEEEKNAQTLETVEENKPVSPEPKAGSAKKGAKSPKGKKVAQVVVIPDEPTEKYLSGSTAVCVMSQAICQTGAVVKKTPLYEYIAELRFGDLPTEQRIPLPMVTIISSGKAAPGKLNCVKEFMVVPRSDMPYNEAFKNISRIYNAIQKTLYTKSGVVIKNTNDNGAICPQFDKPEQGLDLLQDTMTQLNFEPGVDFNIALNCAGHEMFDYDKGKYEVVSGQQRSSEDMAEFWADIVSRYPSVIALIDPIRCVEKEAWMKICERISETCYVMGDAALHRPGLLKDEEITEDFKTSGVVFHWDNVTTLSEILDCAKKMEEADNQVVIAGNAGESSDTILADLAVGIGAKFIKIGAPCRGERVAKFNHLLHIESCLSQQGRLGVWTPHIFPKIELPPEPEPAEGDDADKTESEPPVAKKK